MITNISDVVKRLETLDIPLAYSHFSAPQTPPFMAYLTEQSHTDGADSRHTLKYTHVRIELYTVSRDFELENRILLMFTDVNVDSESIFIKDEELYCTYFDFDFVEKL